MQRDQLLVNYDTEDLDSECYVTVATQTSIPYLDELNPLGSIISGPRLPLPREIIRDVETRSLFHKNTSENDDCKKPFTIAEGKSTSMIKESSATLDNDIIAIKSYIRLANNASCVKVMNSVLDTISINFRQEQKKQKMEDAKKEETPTKKSLMTIISNTLCPKLSEPTIQTEKKKEPADLSVKTSKSITIDNPFPKSLERVNSKHEQGASVTRVQIIGVKEDPVKGSTFYLTDNIEVEPETNEDTESEINPLNLVPTLENIKSTVGMLCDKVCVVTKETVETIKTESANAIDVIHKKSAEQVEKLNIGEKTNKVVNKIQEKADTVKSAINKNVDLDGITDSFKMQNNFEKSSKYDDPTPKDVAYVHAPVSLSSSMYTAIKSKIISFFQSDVQDEKVERDTKVSTNIEELTSKSDVANIEVEFPEELDTEDRAKTVTSEEKESEEKNDLPQEEHPE